MGHIFISYSHHDTEYAHALAENLQNMGLDVWIDERMDYGSQWPHELQKQLDSCSAFVLIDEVPLLCVRLGAERITACQTQAKTDLSTVAGR